MKQSALIIFLCTGILFADIPPSRQRIDFHSALFSNEKCREMAGIPSSGSADPAELQMKFQRLLTTLAELGYPLAQIDSIARRDDSGKPVWDAYLSAGLPLIGIHLPSDTTDQPENVILTQRQIFDTAYDMLSDLTGSGYPFASITAIPRNIELGADSLTGQVEYRVSRGEFMRVGAVSFPGQIYPESRILALESRIRRGDVFSQNALDRALDRLKRMDNIDAVGEVSLTRSSTGVVKINIPVKERRVNRFSGAATIDPDDSKPSGEAHISFRNILGTGRSLNFTWLGLSNGRHGIELAYREPWIMSQPVHVETAMERWSEDTLGTITRFKLGLDWEPGIHLAIGGELEREQIQTAALDSRDDDSETTWLEAHGELDYTDHTWNPSRGFTFSTETSSGLRRVEGKSGMKNVQREAISARYALELRRSVIAYAHGSTRHLRGDDIAIAELNRLGGINSVRGFSEERYRARGIGWLNMELRWRPDKAAFYGIFTDVGIIHHSDDRLESTEKTFVSYGVNAGFSIPSGRVGLAIGLPTGEAIQQSRLHLSIENWF